jgi:hypothetical protein
MIGQLVTVDRVSQRRPAVREKVWISSISEPRKAVWGRRDWNTINPSIETHRMSNYPPDAASLGLLCSLPRNPLTGSNAYYSVMD